MSDEDESTPTGFIVAAERAILKFLSDRKADTASREDPERPPSNKWRTIGYAQFLSNKQRPSKNWRQLSTKT